MLNLEINDYEKTRKSIEYVLRKFNLSIEATDLTQEYFLRKLEGKSRSQSIENFVIDYLRKYSGRKGTASYDTRKSLLFGDTEQIENIRTELSSTNCDHEYTDHNSKFRRYVKNERIIHLLDMGYSKKEISIELNISSSRVSQLVKKIKFRYEIFNFLSMLNLNKNTMDIIINEF